MKDSLICVTKVHLPDRLILGSTGPLGSTPIWFIWLSSGRPPLLGPRPLRKVRRSLPYEKETWEGPRNNPARGLLVTCRKGLPGNLSLVSREGPMPARQSPQLCAVQGLAEACDLPSHSHAPNSTFISEWEALETNTPPQKLPPEPREPCTPRHGAMPFRQSGLASWQNLTVLLLVQ